MNCTTLRTKNPEPKPPQLPNSDLGNKSCIRHGRTKRLLTAGKSSIPSHVYNLIDYRAMRPTSSTVTIPLKTYRPTHLPSPKTAIQTLTPLSPCQLPTEEPRSQLPNKTIPPQPVQFSMPKHASRREKQRLRQAN